MPSNGNLAAGGDQGSKALTKKDMPGLKEQPSTGGSVTAAHRSDLHLAGGTTALLSGDPFKNPIYCALALQQGSARTVRASQFH